MFSERSVIRLDRVSKAYRIYVRPIDRLKRLMVDAAAGAVPRRWFPEYGHEHLALRDIDLEVGPGETVGLIGPNGAGKSTLLQIVCGTVQPTSGSVEVRGRIAALLELGSGFNPEFTGRENVFLNGAVLGLSRTEIENRFDEIAAFADIGEFLEQPVKTYSSGMYARLAFSVAVCVSPDILIVDEALSVGDGWFQHKSMARMRRLMESGATVLFVSHSVDAVRSICQRAVWLERGGVRMKGKSASVTNAYMNEVFLEYNRVAQERIADVVAATSMPEAANVPVDEVGPSSQQASDSPSTPPAGDGAIRVVSVHVIGETGLPVERLRQGERFVIRVTVDVLKDIDNLSIGILLKDRFGLDLTGESVFNKYRNGLSRSAGSRLRVEFRSKMVLRGGEGYSVAVRVNQVSRWDRSDNVLIHNDDTAAVFDVAMDPDEPMWFKFKQDIEVDVLI